jgi:hypothetical protein
LIVHARAKDKSGRDDEDFGVVAFKGGGGEFMANAMMKAVTKAKRRVTLSISGLGFLDETEVPTTHEPTGAVISKAQLEELIALADEVGADKRAFLHFLGDRWEMEIASLAAIPVAYFDDAMAQLERKRERSNATMPKGMPVNAPTHRHQATVMACSPNIQNSLRTRNYLDMLEGSTD